MLHSASLFGNLCPEEWLRKQAVNIVYFEWRWSCDATISHRWLHHNHQSVHFTWERIWQAPSGYWQRGGWVEESIDNGTRGCRREDPFEILHYLEALGYGTADAKVCNSDNYGNLATKPALEDFCLRAVVWRWQGSYFDWTGQVCRSSNLICLALHVPSPVVQVFSLPSVQQWTAVRSTGVARISQSTAVQPAGSARTVEWDAATEGPFSKLSTNKDLEK